MKACLALSASLALVALSPRAARSDALESKKQLFLEAKATGKLSKAQKAQWHKSLDKRVGKRPSTTVNIYNLWTHEMLAFDAGETAGPKAEVVNQFLRCHFTNAPTSMASELFPVLLKAAQKFRVQRVNIVSGFRDPKYNLTLRKKGHQVARESEHTEGHAVDFRLPGVRTEALHQWARSLHLGGVGFYKSSGFVHVDVGRVRYWNGT